MICNTGAGRAGLRVETRCVGKVAATRAIAVIFLTVYDQADKIEPSDSGLGNELNTRGFVLSIGVVQ